ncbi:hypothetical protein KVT40_005321 [Elsinoe batatas]|uniref:Uncharacterized protein n=1 Tax=Elsinoe batatas TaxID=2601811 RepID=A0A8K0L2C0_9PEZI|nr:hypothetical protein KVT40_005321 [Elsinoe batatas]
MRASHLLPFMLGPVFAANPESYSSSMSTPMSGTLCACSQLSSQLPQAYLTPNSTAYTSENLRLWDRRCNKTPSCIFKSPAQLFRINQWHHTIATDGDRLAQIYREWRDSLADLKDVEGLMASFVVNHAPKSAARVALRNGVGNVWGLPDDVSRILWQFSTGWQRPEDDQRVQKWSKSLIECLHRENKKMGLATEYLYAGDASVDIEVDDAALLLLPRRGRRRSALWVVRAPCPTMTTPW